MIDTPTCVEGSCASCASLQASIRTLEAFVQHKVTCDKGRVCAVCGRYEEDEVHGHDFHKGYGHEFEPSGNCTCGLADALALLTREKG